MDREKIKNLSLKELWQISCSTELTPEDRHIAAGRYEVLVDIKIKWAKTSHSCRVLYNSLKRENDDWMNTYNKVFFKRALGLAQSVKDLLWVYSEITQEKKVVLEKMFSLATTEKELWKVYERSSEYNELQEKVLRKIQKNNSELRKKQRRRQ